MQKSVRANALCTVLLTLILPALVLLRKPLFGLTKRQLARALSEIRNIMNDKYRQTAIDKNHKNSIMIKGGNMAIGILYVVYNQWIRNPDTNEIPYKIGITKKTIDERYYGLGLKMPGKFEVLFAYEIENYDKVEKIIHDMLYLYCENGEWFNIKEREIDHIKATCELMNGVDITDKIVNEVEKQTEENFSTMNPEENINSIYPVIMKILAEYEFINIVSIKKQNTWINFATNKMDEIFPQNELKKNGSWHDGTKYHYWFEIDENKTFFCFELGSYDQDNEIIKKMNKITSLYNKNNVSADDKYRRIYKWTLNIGLRRKNNEEMIISEVKTIITNILKEEEKILKVLGASNLSLCL